MLREVKEDNKIDTDLELSNTSNPEIGSACDKSDDNDFSFDENQLESLYTIKETVEGLENYLEYLRKLEYELNGVKDDFKQNK
jgi:hypothetical protein